MKSDKILKSIVDHDMKSLEESMPSGFDLSFQEYQKICNETIQQDWSLGIIYLRQWANQSPHAWYWEKPEAKQNPGQAVFRAFHFAKPQCAKELIKDASPECLTQILVLGSSNFSRPLRVTQNRIRCLSYISKAFSNLEEDVRKKYLDRNRLSIRSVLENEKQEIIKSFMSVWDTSEVWNTLWSDSQHYIKSGILEPSSQASQWARCVELLWQTTGDVSVIPINVKDELLSVAQKNDNKKFLPLICSELLRKTLQEALKDTDPKQKHPKKKM